MEENPYKAPRNFGQQSRWPLPKWKWYEWAVVAIVMGVLIALLLPAQQSDHYRRRPRQTEESANDSPAQFPGSPKSETVSPPDVQ
jgi:hypothetical protein